MKKKPVEFILMRGFLSFQILHELQVNSLCGDDLAEIIGGKKGRKLTPGTIYPALRLLHKKQLILYKRNGRKKIYSSTVLGKKEYKRVRRKFLELFRGVLYVSYT